MKTKPIEIFKTNAPFSIVLVVILYFLPDVTDMISWTDTKLSPSWAAPVSIASIIQFIIVLFGTATLRTVIMLENKKLSKKDFKRLLLVCKRGFPLFILAYLAQWLLDTSTLSAYSSLLDLISLLKKTGNGTLGGGELNTLIKFFIILAVNIQLFVAFSRIKTGAFDSLTFSKETVKSFLKIKPRQWIYGSLGLFLSMLVVTANPCATHIADFMPKYLSFEACSAPSLNFLITSLIVLMVSFLPAIEVAIYREYKDIQKRQI